MPLNVLFAEGEMHVRIGGTRITAQRERKEQPRRREDLGWHEKVREENRAGGRGGGEKKALEKSLPRQDPESDGGAGARGHCERVSNARRTREGGEGAGRGGAERSSSGCESQSPALEPTSGESERAQAAGGCGAKERQGAAALVPLRVV